MENTIDLPETLAERIKKLLGQNLPTSVVASAVGCDPSYVSQLLEDEEFKNEVLLARAKRAEGAIARDQLWDSVENMALDKAVQMIPLVSRPNDLVRLAAMANAAKRRSAEYSGAQETGSAVVNIVLPSIAAVHFQMNAQAQVVEVDGRSTAPLATKNLATMMKERKEIRDAQGIVEVAIPKLEAPSTVERTEKKKVQSILESIGYADETVPVTKII